MKEGERNKLDKKRRDVISTFPFDARKQIACFLRFVSFCLSHYLSLSHTHSVTSFLSLSSDSLQYEERENGKGLEKLTSKKLRTIFLHKNWFVFL